MTREEQRDYSKQYNIFTLEELQAKYPNFNWKSYFSGLGLNNVNRVCVSQLDFMKKVDELISTLKEKEIKEYLIFKYMDAAAPYLSDAFNEANFDVYSRALSGKQVMQPRWKRSLNVPNTLLGEGVGQLYVEKYFPAESKKKMKQLVDNLRIALGERISSLTWMSPKTKVNALVKLNSFTVKIGYPDKWRDYSAVAVNPELSYWENVLALKKFDAQFSYSQLGQPVDKDRWQMTPQTVNAYYDPSTNEICFPAGILQRPYFDSDADDACNYGAIGVVIGHEMTHGFDDQGRNFDQMVIWLTGGLKKMQKSSKSWLTNLAHNIAQKSLPTMFMLMAHSPWVKILLTTVDCVWLTLHSRKPSKVRAILLLMDSLLTNAST